MVLQSWWGKASPRAYFGAPKQSGRRFVSSLTPTEAIPLPHAPKWREIHAKRVKILRKMTHGFAGIRFFHVLYAFFKKDFVWHQ
jgi:hypothetical protein